MILSTKKIFNKCYGRYGIAALNVWCMEQVHGLFSAAQKANAPFIVQTTPVARNYASAEMLLAIISAASKIYPDTVFAVHLDHGNMEHAIDSIESGGYNSVMIDASHESFERNIELTKKVIENAFEVMAIELITVVQAIEYLKAQDKVSSKTRKLYNEIRELVPIFTEDVIMYPYVNRVKDYIINNKA